MNLFSRGEYDLKDDVSKLNHELTQIQQLKDLRGHVAWKQVEKIFIQVITNYSQDVFDMCDNPTKHAIEIKCKKMVADSLGRILELLNNRIATESIVQEQITERMEVTKNPSIRQTL